MPMISGQLMSYWPKQLELSRNDSVGSDFS
jgi:hypothetical protein